MQQVQETAEHHVVDYGTKQLAFGLSYANRKTLGIHVYPDSSVQVIAPAHASLEKIYQKVQKRAAWIVRQQRFFEKVEPKPEHYEYVGGETHYYLGRQYRIRVQELEEGKETVKLHGAFFYVYVHDRKDSGTIRKLMENWYQEHAKQKFRERLNACYKAMKREGIPYPEIVLRSMPNRWGSCTESGRILLNPALICYPVYCIDYVLVHELCHLVHPNHSKEFYQLKEKYLPDWRGRKRRLER